MKKKTISVEIGTSGLIASMFPTVFVIYQTLKSSRSNLSSESDIWQADRNKIVLSHRNDSDGLKSYWVRYRKHLGDE